MRYPAILKILFPLIIGIIVAYFSGVYISAIPVLGGLILSIFLGFSSVGKKYLGQILFTYLLSISFFLIGAFLVHVHDSTNNSNYFGNKSDGWNNYQVQVLEPPTEKENSYKLVVEVLQVEDESSCGKALIYVKKDSASEHIKYGDILALNSQFNSIRSNGNPMEFNYAHYLEIHNIHHQAYVRSGSWTKVDSRPNMLMSWVYELRSYFSNVIYNSSMSSKNATVASALLLGQKEYLDKDILRSYSSAGAMHVLAVSGLHVGIIMLILTFLFKPIKQLKYGKTIYLTFVLGGIWVYALITGMSPSVMRASVMFTFVVVGNELERDTSIYQSILVSAFLLIILDPLIIFQVGFQLSYAAVLGIVYLQPKIENLIYVKNKLLLKAWQISTVSIAAQIATFPLGLYYFHQFPNFFLVSNLMVIPLAFFILIIGVSYLILNEVPIISEALFWVLDHLLSFLNRGVEWVERLPYSISWGFSIHWYEVILMYAAILLGSIAFISRKSRALVASLSLCTVLLVLNIIEHRELSSQNQICVYNVNGETAIDVFIGRQNIFISSEKLMDDEEKLLFHVKHNWFYRTGKEEPSKWLNLEESTSFKVAQETFSILSQSDIDLGEVDNSKTVLLRNVEFIPEDLITYWKTKETKLIFGSGVKSGVKKYLVSRYQSIPVHDLKEDGAYICTID